MVSRSELGYLYRIWEDYRALHVSPIYLRAMQASRCGRVEKSDSTCRAGAYVVGIGFCFIPFS